MGLAELCGEVERPARGVVWARPDQRLEVAKVVFWGVPLQRECTQQSWGSRRSGVGGESFILEKSH